MRTRIPRTWKERWRLARQAAPTRLGALRICAAYVGARLWALLMHVFPVEVNLQTARFMARIWWRIRSRELNRALEHLRMALGDRYSEEQLVQIARRSFEHLTQLYLVELVVSARLLTVWSWARYIELDELAPAMRLLLQQRGVLLLTGHHGNYELLGIALARLGLPMHAVMRPLDNPLLNAFLIESRAATGLTLIDKKGAARQFPQILSNGEALAFIADQDAGKRGIFSEFFGRKASWYKSIALIALEHRAPIVVGAALRVREGFRYRVYMERIIQPEEWESQPNPLQWITDNYAAAIEQSIRRSPEQYLWIHRRWKTRPPEELDAPADQADMIAS